MSLLFFSSTIFQSHCMFNIVFFATFRNEKCVTPGLPVWNSAIFQTEGDLFQIWLFIIYLAAVGLRGVCCGVDWCLPAVLDFTTSKKQTVSFLCALQFPCQDTYINRRSFRALDAKCCCCFAVNLLLFYVFIYG